MTVTPVTAMKFQVPIKIDYGFSFWYISRCQLKLTAAYPFGKFSRSQLKLTTAQPFGKFPGPN
jgi:hypothetical protein